ncbi:MAG: hypothetical protein D6714_04125 [Bacteroidetes bacterium]|nr:MAG: hypothetical protein D6714_04125 [Bacteroidota bacterium]
MKYFERIEKYLNEEMTPEEKVAFQRDLKQDEALKTAFLIQKAESEAIERMALEHLRGRLREVRKTSAKPSPNIRRLPRWAAVAAGVLVVLGCLWVWSQMGQPNAREKLVERAFQKTFAGFSTSVRSLSTDTELQKHLTLLENGDRLSEVIAFLQSLPPEHPAFARTRLDLALAYYKNGQFENSVRQCSEYLKLAPENYEAPYAEYLGFLAATRAGNEVEANAFWERIRKKPNHPFFNNVSELRAQLTKQSD